MTFVIGDVHGCIRTLERLIEKIRVADDSPNLVFVGDYLDRGPASKEVIDLVISLNATCLRGNHEDVVDWLVNDHSLTDMREYVRGKPTIDTVAQWWLNNGLAETLQSYGVLPMPDNVGPYSPPSWDSLIHRFREKMPESHKQFIKNLPIFWESDTHFACHAYFHPDSEMARPLHWYAVTHELAHYTLWHRFSQDLQDGTFKPPTDIRWSKIGVFGHTPVQTYRAVAPIKYDKIRLIDCLVWKGEYLCAYCCETDDTILQSTDDGDLL